MCVVSAEDLIKKRALAGGRTHGNGENDKGRQYSIQASEPRVGRGWDGRMLGGCMWVVCPCSMALARLWVVGKEGREEGGGGLRGEADCSVCVCVCVESRTAGGLFRGIRVDAYPGSALGERREQIQH